MNDFIISCNADLAYSLIGKGVFCTRYELRARCTSCDKKFMH